MSEVRHPPQQLEFQAVTDPLTGLLNRRGFHHAMEHTLLRTERSEHALVLLYLDLDGFKRLNDALGHDAGDRVLRWVSEQMQACLRFYDILGRMGGDEFTALLALEFPEPAEKIAGKLIAQASVCSYVAGLEVMLVVCIGTAAFLASGVAFRGLLRAGVCAT
uniref:GGDEF domain-containing protein n=1 Tax=Pseudomonas paracarnis TaxID=2750625 RepID=UPI00191BA8A9